MEIYWSSLQTARHERELNIFQSGSIKLSQKASYHVTTAGAFSLFTQLVSRAEDHMGFSVPIHANANGL